MSEEPDTSLRFSLSKIDIYSFRHSYGCLYDSEIIDNYEREVIYGHKNDSRFLVKYDGGMRNDLPKLHFKSQTKPATGQKYVKLTNYEIIRTHFICRFDAYITIKICGKYDTTRTRCMFELIM